MTRKPKKNLMAKSLRKRQSLKGLGYYLFAGKNFLMEWPVLTALVLAFALTGCTALHHALEPTGKIQDPPPAGTK